nr:MFS transporter [Roseibium litorale]
MTSGKGLSLRVGCLFASYFLGFGIFLPFFPLVLKDRGIPVEEIGFILGAGTIARIIANPLMTGLSDHTGRRRLSILLYSLASIAFLVFFLMTGGVWNALIAVVGLLVFWSPVVPLSDAYALDVVRNYGADYGRMRLWGSAAFVVSNMIGGWLILLDSSTPAVVAVMIGILSTGLVAISLPPQVSSVRAEGGTADERPRLFLRPAFWLILAVVGLLQGSHAAFYGFSTLFWKAHDVSEFLIGVLWSTGVAAEIGLFLFAGRLGLTAYPLTLLLMGAGAGILRWGLFPFAQDFWSMALLQLLHTMTFGMAHLGSVGYLSRIVPPKWAATGQGFLAASNGILMAVGYAVCGPLYQWNPGYPFWLMSGLSCVALAGLIALRPLMQRTIAEAAAD